MSRIIQEKLNLAQRTIEVELVEIFPNLDREEVHTQFSHLRFNGYHHLTAAAVARELSRGGYEKLIQSQGFYDPDKNQYTGHCHQSTPMLGLVLIALGFTNVAYLEGFRIRDNFSQTGIIEMIPPQEEQDQSNRLEFIKIGRIPYCCLEIDIGGVKKYISAKHVQAIEGSVSYTHLTLPTKA